MNDSLVNQTALQAATPKQILATYEALLAELRARGVTRTNDAPSGQYAEWLACKALGGTLMPNSVKSYDLIDANERRVQVKSRVVRNPKRVGQRQLSPFRSFDFDDALIVIFDTTYDVIRAVLLPPTTVQELAVHRAHVNGHVLTATDAVLDLGVDVTGRFEYEYSSLH